MLPIFEGLVKLGSKLELRNMNHINGAELVGRSTMAHYSDLIRNITALKRYIAIIFTIIWPIGVCLIISSIFLEKQIWLDGIQYIRNVFSI